MRKNYNVIKISGFKGVIFAIFIVGCLIAGFLTFPGWACMHIWNFVAGFFDNAPQMSLIHGVLMWCIIALSIYALNQGNFCISFGGAPVHSPSEERIKEILRQVHEKNSSIIPIESVVKNESEDLESDNVSKDDII